MRTAIIGAGIGGSYLCNFLQKKHPDVQIDMYSILNMTKCRTRPCGWLVNYHEFMKLGRELDMNFSQYVLEKFDCMEVQGQRLYADVATIDKPLLIRELLGEVEVMYDIPDIAEYDKVVDATGVGAYLPPRRDGTVVEIHQARFENRGHQCPEAFIDSDYFGLGYIIPLGDGTAHVGFWAITELEKAKELVSDGKALCGCTSSLWMGGSSFPVVHGKVCGIGESIGLVDPLSGAGIIPAMDSARALVQYWDDLQKYEDYIKHHYKFMVRRARALRSNNLIVKVFNLILSHRKSSKLIGFSVGARGLIDLIKLTCESTKYMSFPQQTSYRSTDFG